MTKDSRKEPSSGKPKRKKLFSIRNLIILLLLVAVAAVFGNMFGLFDKLPFVGQETAVHDQPAEDALPPAASHEAAQETAAGEHAGGQTVADVMNTQFLAIEETATAGQAVQLLKNREIGPHSPQVVFVTDSLGRLVGVSSPAKLLVAPEEETVKVLMDPGAKAVELDADAASAQKALHAAESGVLPVVDKAGRLIGVIAAGEPEDKTMAPAEGQPHQAGPMHASSAPAHEAKAAEATHAAQAPEQTHGTEQSAGTGQAQASAGEHAAQQGHMAAAQGGHTPQAQHAAVPAAKAQEQPTKAGEHAAAAPASHGQPAASESAQGGGHGAAPAAKQPTGVAFVEAMVKPLKYELDDRWWGWRPNDILDFTDNVNNFQLGVLEVTRRAAVALAERISRTGTIEQFDVNVQNAMNWLMVKSDRYWLPSPEYKYGSAIEELEKYRDRLMQGEASFYTRQDNLIPLLLAFKDLLGSSEENLVKSKEKDGASVSYFKADDYFYYAQGVVSAMGTMLEAVAVDFHDTVQSRRGSDELHHAIHWCHEALKIHPWLVLDSGYSSVFANHRVNLAGPISHIRFHLGVLITTLST